MPKDAPKEDTGHEPAGATKDAFDLSDDEFSEVVANAEQSDSDDDTKKSDLEADTDGGDTGKPDAKPDADADPLWRNLCRGQTRVGDGHASSGDG